MLAAIIATFIGMALHKKEEQAEDDLLAIPPKK
jgi:hypothetical protein